MTKEEKILELKAKKISFLKSLIAEIRVLLQFYKTDFQMTDIFNKIIELRNEAEKKVRDI